MRFVFAYPGDLETRTGGYTYNRHVIAEMRGEGHEIALLPLGDGFPRPNQTCLEQAVQAIANVAVGTPIVIDGLALGTSPALAQAAAQRGPLVALVHHPLALETGLAASDVAAFQEAERLALRHASAVIVTSDPTAETLISSYGVERNMITVAKPGTLHTSFAKGSGGSQVALLSVAAISPRKGFHILMRALADLVDLPWHLDLVGNEDIDPVTSAALRKQIHDLGLARRVTQFGSLPHQALAARYEAADVFVLASLYEGYGMVYAEALSHGLPVIGTTGGAIPSVVPADAGLLVAPGDVASLRDALRIMISDPAARAGFAAGAQRAALLLPTWQQAAHQIVNAIQAAQQSARAS